ncbi:hypothetical protein ANRL1_04893 [Anaerolineae bacterium]|nr:hypothetical protein ANRL1_04893 [Anaerolineae bacterium]
MHYQENNEDVRDHAMTNDEPGKPKKPRLGAWFWATAGVFMCVIVALLLNVFKVDVDGLLRFPDRLAAFPTVEADYRRYHDAALGASPEVWLKAHQDYDYPLQLLRGRFYRGCIRAGFSRTFGTNKTFAEIRIHYMLQLSQLGWRDFDQYPGVYAVQSNLWLSEVSPASMGFEIGREQYQTIFRLTLTYADPALDRCYG